MEEFSKYFKNNKELWDKKTSIHENSDFYDIPGFIGSGNSLHKIEESLLPDLNGKSVLHLQCHFGMDSISLQLKGADVTAVDLSSESIALANKLNEKMETSVHFVECNVYDTPQHVSGPFDIVFTSYGAICWLPDLKPWAEVIDKMLKPGGKLILVEFHPLMYMYDFASGEVLYHYFNRKVYEETNTGTYANTHANLRHKEYFWNHAISEVTRPLLGLNMEWLSFAEYDYSPYDCFENMEKRAENEYIYRGVSVSIPHIYSIVMSKKFDI